jgi:exo-beta-1,3-glucanase (GH17 family)
MRTNKLKLLTPIIASAVLFGCGQDSLDSGNGNLPAVGQILAPQPTPATFPTARNGDALLGNPNYQAVSYGAWRADDRADGNDVPSVEMQKEDMKILSAMGIKVIRTYNTQGYKGTDGQTNTENLLQAIDELMLEDENFEMYVMLGVWIDALNSWTGNPIDPSTGNQANDLEMAKAKELALAYPDIVKVIAVGNESMVDWATSYHVQPGVVLDYVEDLQTWKLEDESTADLWVTSSDNHAVWAGTGHIGAQEDLDALIRAVDYVSLHTYAMHDTYYHPEFSEQWKVPESQQGWDTTAQVDAAMERAYDYTIDQIAVAQAYVNSVDATKPIHIGETGWTTSTGDWKFGAAGTHAADEYKQKRFYEDMRQFADEFGASLFFFQAFDEPWKGGTDLTDPEKHFGLIDINGNVKYVAWDKVDALNDLGLTRGQDVQVFTQSYGGDLPSLMETVLPPPYAPVEQPPEAGEFKVLGAAAFAAAVDWEGTAWPSVDDETGILTVTPAVPAPQPWGWGAMIGDNNPRDLSDKSTIRFEIRGSTEQGRPLANFVFGVGFQTDYGEWGTNHSIKFNDGSGYTLTEEWQTITIDIASDLPASVSELVKVKNPLIVHHTSVDANLTESDIQLRNVSWFE